MADPIGPSIRDVARLAGVSHQTVSRVLNNPAAVAASTRMRVDRAIAQLGYRPNVAARALKTHRSQLVGVLVARNSLFVAQDGLSRLEMTLRDRGMRVLMSGLAGSSRSDARHSVAPLLAQGVDAVVIAANEAGARELAYELAGAYPVVVLTPGVTAEAGLSSAAIDLEAGVKDVVAHLVDRGDRLLRHIAGPPTYTTTAARATAWIHELNHRELPVRPIVNVVNTAQGGYDAARAILDHDVPDAIFCFNDLVAIGAIRALQERGLRVPHDVAVVGVDDMPGADHVLPSLTTLRQPLQDLGEVGATLLLELLAGQPARSALIAPELVVRESSAGTRERGS